MYTAQSAQEGMAIPQTLARCRNFLHVPKPRGNPKIDGRLHDFDIFIKDGYHKSEFVRCEIGTVRTLQLKPITKNRNLFILGRGRLKKHPELNFVESES